MTPFVAGLFRELLKVGFVSPEEAQSSIDRYEQLQKSRPTGEQVGRYAGLGATAAVGGHLVQSAIEGNRPFSLQKGPAFSKKNTPKVLRGVAGRAAVGAITGGLMPLVRSHMDQQAEAKKIKAFLADNVEPSPAPKLGSLGGDFLEAVGISKKHNIRQGARRAAATGALAAGSMSMLPLYAGLSSLVRDEELAKKVRQHPTIASELHGKSRRWGPVGMYDDNFAAAMVNGRKGGTLILGNSAAKSPGVVGHEMGHVLNNMDSPLLHAVAVGRHGRIAGIIGSQVAGAAATLADSAGKRKALLALPSLFHVPTLIDEAAASARGVHLVGQHGGATAAAKAALPLVPAFGSYAGEAAMSSMAAYNNYKMLMQMQPLPKRLRHFAQDHADELRRLGTRAGVAGAVLAPAAALAAYAATRKDKGKTAGVGPGAPMTTSEYSGPSGGGGFNLVSDLNPKAPPSLRAVVEKKAALEGALFPKGRTPGQLLRAAKNVGTTKHDAPIGPSLDQIAGRVQPAFAKAPGVPKLKNWGLPPPGTTNPGKMLPQVRPIRIAKG